MPVLAEGDLERRDVEPSPMNYDTRRPTTASTEVGGAKTRAEMKPQRQRDIRVFGDLGTDASYILACGQNF